MTVLKKNNLFDKRLRYFVLFLQNLKLKKNKNLFNRNFITNYYYYNYFLKNLKNNKKLFLYRSLFLLNNTKSVINPIFFFKKQIFNLNTQYINFLFNNSLENLVLNKKYLNNFYKTPFIFCSFGTSSLIISKKELKIDLNIEENKNIFNLKNFENNFDRNNFDFFLNNLIFFTNLIELYKVIILINLFKLNN
jgi:hypothetical protein